MQRARVFPAIILAGFTWCAAQAPRQIEVAPGIVLPADSDATAFALDQTSSGPSLVHIPPHEVFLDRHATGNFLRGEVMMGPHISAVLHGVRSETALASTKAVFFVRLTGEDAEIKKTRVHLVWLDPNKKDREAAEFTSNIFAGQQRRFLYDVPSSVGMVEGTSWLKITPNEPLSAGEFSIAFFPADVNRAPDSAFDFSVACGAPPCAPGSYAAKSTSPDQAKTKH